MEPHATQHPQNALAGRGERRPIGSSAAALAARAAAAHPGNGTAEPSDVPHGCPWLPAHTGQETERETRVSDRRYRAGGRPGAPEEQGGACGSHGSQSQRCDYDCREAWDSQRHRLSLLYPPAA
ncbi:MAG: hypothetical protein ACXWPS_04050 [Ktedonobacteraceae bacterium]